MKEKEYAITELKDNPGIFFEAIGNMRTSEISWKMIVYIDLRDIKDATAKLDQQMDLILQQCDYHTSYCEIRPRLSSLTAKLNKMKHYQNHISELIGESRMKRAPLEFVGQISKIIFGTLTTEDAQNMHAAIMHVENKTNDLALLLMNQTIATRTRFGELYNTTLKIRKQLTALEIETMRNQKHRYFWEIMTKLDTEILQHEIDLNILIDGILFGKQGLIHPRLISPQQLIKNCKLIKEQNPHVEFPVNTDETGMDRLVKISDLRIAYSNNRLIYILHIPLLIPGIYKIYKPTPLPAKQTFDKMKFAVIKSDAEYIGINEDTDSFYEFQEGELHECISLDAAFICPAVFPLKKIRQATSCNIELLLNKNARMKYCEIILQELRETYWKTLITPGNWIYSTMKPEIIRIECQRIKQAEINNSGIISVQQGCKIRAGTTTMSHPSIRTMKFAQHYVPTNNLSIIKLYEPIRTQYQVELTEAARELWTTNNSHEETTFNDIIEKARQIKDRKLQEQRYIAYSAVGCGMGILGTLMVIILLISRISWISSTTNLLYARCCRKKETKGSTPCPSVENKSRDTEPGSEQSDEREAETHETKELHAGSEAKREQQQVQ